MSCVGALSVKEPGERIPVAFLFAADAAAGDVLNGAAVTVDGLAAGTDPTPNAILDGVPAISGLTAVQWVHNGVDGASYRLKCVATTAEGRVLILRAVLPVRTPA